MYLSNSYTSNPFSFSANSPPHTCQPDISITVIPTTVMPIPEVCIPVIPSLSQMIPSQTHVCSLTGSHAYIAHMGMISWVLQHDISSPTPPTSEAHKDNLQIQGIPNI